MSTTKVSLKGLRARKKELLYGIKPVKDEDIDYSDIPETDFNKINWDEVKVCPPVGKERITIRLDSDVLTWFRKSKKYQTLINNVLRHFYEANQKN